MIVNIPASGGLHTGTIFENGVLTLNVENFITKYPGVGGGYWFESEAISTIDGDKVSVDNVVASNYYLYSTTQLNQTAATPITVRLKVRGNVPNPASNGYSIRVEMYSMIDSVYVNRADVYQNFPAGEFFDTQFTVNVTPTGAAQYCVIFIFARYGVGSLTVWDVEAFETVGSIRQNYGEWSSDPIDLYEEINSEITTSGLELEHICFYYNDLSNIDYQDSVEHSIGVLSKFSTVVTNPPSQNSTDRQHYVEQALVAAGVKVYGYINGAIPEYQYNDFTPPVSVQEGFMDSCHGSGYTGVFFDGGGFGGLSVEHMNHLVDYAKALVPPLSVFVNARPQQSINTAVETWTLSNPVGFPTISAVLDGSSTLLAGTYKVAFSYYNYNGETLIGGISEVIITAGQGIQVGPIYGYTESALGANVYVSESANSSTLKRYNTSPYQGAQMIVTTLPIGVTIPLTNTAYTHNPNGIASHLNPVDDLLLWESFFTRSDNQYSGFHDSSFSNAFNEWKVGMEMARAYGIRVVAMPYVLNDTVIDDYTVPDEAYRIALSLGFYGISYVNPLVPILPVWYDQPKKTYGSQIVEYMSLYDSANNVYRAITNSGVIWLRTTDSPLTRVGGSFSTILTGLQKAKNTIILGSVPSSNADFVDGVWETSSDKTTWTEFTGTRFAISAEQRYLRYRVELRS